LLQSTFTSYNFTLTLLKDFNFVFKRFFLLLQTTFLSLQLGSSLCIISFHSCTKARCFVTRFMQRLALLHLEFHELLLTFLLFDAQTICKVLFISCRPDNISSNQSHAGSENQKHQGDNDFRCLHVGLPPISKCEQAFKGVKGYNNHTYM